MRANITYSVDVQDIPQEVARIVTGATATFTTSLAEVKQALDGSNLLEARSRLMSARQSLINIDIRLREMDQILAGYIDISNEESLDTPPDEQVSE